MPFNLWLFFTSKCLLINSYGVSCNLRILINFSFWVESFLHPQKSGLGKISTLIACHWFYGRDCKYILLIPFLKIRIHLSITYVIKLCFWMRVEIRNDPGCVWGVVVAKLRKDRSPFWIWNVYSERLDIKPLTFTSAFTCLDFGEIKMGSNFLKPFP